LETYERHRTLRFTLVLVAMSLVLLALMALNITLGSVKIPLSEIVRILTGGSTNETAAQILWKIRMPRALAGALLGAALALSGFLLQTFFGNPIAGPYVLGIASGAKLTVSIVLVCVLSAGRAVSAAGLIGAAFVGSMISMSFVLLIAQKVHRSAMLVISGVMIGYICSAITDFIITFADDASIVNLHNWSKGSFSGMSWDNVAVIAVVVSIASLTVFLLSKPIGAYRLGEAYAQNMGVNIRVFRIALVFLSSILSACVTAFAGPISFVGIAVPHIVKSLLKTAKPILVIPVCFIGGAIFCLGCDLIARTVFAPTELSVSSVTAIFGAPVVILLLIKRRKNV